MLSKSYEKTSGELTFGRGETTLSWGETTSSWGETTLSWGETTWGETTVISIRLPARSLTAQSGRDEEGTLESPVYEAATDGIKMAAKEHVGDLRTPAFLIDLETVENNCKAMIERCRSLGVELRTNMKTHRTL